MRVICDTETESLEGYTKLWCVVTRDIDTGDINVFRNVHEDEGERQRLEVFSQGVREWVGHNWINFDADVLSVLGGVDIARSSVIDTLVLSRLLDYNRVGGHSLEAWGDQLGQEKSSYSDFSRYSDALVDRCIKDTEINYLLYKRFERHLQSERWAAPIQTEHKLAWLCKDLNKTGIYFDLPSCKAMKEVLYNTLEELENTFSSLFPPLAVPIREITPSVTSKGTLKLKDFYWKEDKDLSTFSSLCPFTLIDWVPFNPGSPKQIVSRLNAAGWQPVNKTKGHIEAQRSGKDLDKFKDLGWKVDEENLATLPEGAPEASRKLAEYLLMKSRYEDLTEWENACTGFKTGFKVYGTFNPIGAWTQRMSHQSPNMANIPSLVNRKGKEQYLGEEMRSLWTAGPGRKLVGVDADGIQLRVFAHYVSDEKLIKAIVSGKKEDKTDIHSLNKSIIGTICNSRDTAKTFIYALFLGAGIGKISEILQCSSSEASKAVGRILDFYPGWARLKKERIPSDASRGYFEGLDGRLVKCPSEHLMLAGYLQNGEKVIMSRAAIKVQEWREKNGLERVFDLVNFVHDELQYDVLEKYEDLVGQRVMQSIVQQGKELSLNCPLAANMKVGKDWSETH